MKKLLAIMMAIMMAVGLTGCGEISEKVVRSVEDMEGYWYHEESNTVMGIEDGEYFMAFFDEMNEIDGTCTVDFKTVIFRPDVGSQSEYPSAKIKDNYLILEEEDGTVWEWKKISEEEAYRLEDEAEENNW